MAEVDLNDPKAVWENLQRLNLIEWHCGKRHGVLRRYMAFDRESRQSILRAVNYHMGENCVWRKGDDIEFAYGFKRRGNKPWGHCGETVLFKDWQTREQTNKIIGSQFKAGDRVQFTDKGTTYTGLVVRVNKRVSVVVEGSGNWGVSPNLLRKVD
jgi:hypothetical protein